MKKWFAFLLICGASYAFAATGAGEHHEGPIEIPKSVIYQTINVLILFGGLFYFLRGTVVKFYRDRQSNFLAAAEKSQAARLAAEKQFAEIKAKIEQLEKTEEESLSRARAEAADMKKALEKEAQEIANRIKQEATETARLETHKAQAQLREQLLSEALQAAKSVLSKDIASTDHQKLQNDFVNNVQAVNP